MGPRRGGGRAGFVKSARGARPEAEDEAPEVPEAASTERAPAAEPQAAPSKAAQFLKDPPASAADEDSGSSDEEGEGGAETRGKMLQRHKRVRRRCFTCRLLVPARAPRLAPSPTAAALAKRRPAGGQGAEGPGEAAGQEGQGRGGAARGGDGGAVSALGPWQLGAAAVAAGQPLLCRTCCQACAPDSKIAKRGGTAAVQQTALVYSAAGCWPPPLRRRRRHAAELAALDGGKQRTAAEAVAVADSLYSVHLGEGGDEQQPAGGKVRRAGSRRAAGCVPCCRPALAAGLVLLRPPPPAPLPACPSHLWTCALLLPPALQKPSKGQKRREARAREEAEREARIAAELAELGDTGGRPRWEAGCCRALMLRAVCCAALHRC